MKTSMKCWCFRRAWGDCVIVVDVVAGSTVAYDKDPVGNAVCALRARLSGSLQGAPHPHPGADELNVAPHPHPGADELNVAPHPHPGADELNVAPHPHPGADELNVAPHPHPGADELNEAPHRHPGADELNEAVAVIRQALEKYTWAEHLD